MKETPEEAVLKKQLRSLGRKIAKIQSRDRMALVETWFGKCFKCKDGYGKSNTFIRYCKVVSIPRNIFRSPVCFEFSKTKDGYFSVESKSSNVYIESGNWKEISELEYAEAWRKFCVALSQAYIDSK